MYFSSAHIKRDLKALLSYRVTKIVLALLIVALLFPFITVFFLQVKPATNIEYGVTFSPSYATYLKIDWKKMYIDILDDLKVNNLRLGAYWSEIEKTPGSYDFADLDFQVNEARKKNAHVILAIGRKVPRWPECHEPLWVQRLNTKDSDEALLKLLEAEVNHFKSYDNIKMWQVENEPYFPFGSCKIPSWNFLKKEVDLVKSLDPTRPVIIQDSGEGGAWAPTYAVSDYLGISMYRRTWFDFWGLFFGKGFFFTYPLTYWSYPLKAKMTGVPLNKIKVLELQTEPWGNGAVDVISQEDKDQTMSQDKFLETISYAQKSGIDSFYFWGVEWWYWEKNVNNNPFFWEASKAFWK